MKKPPKHLSREAKIWWRAVLEGYTLEPHHEKLLQAVCESWDRIQEARDQISEAGPFYVDRFGQPREHPAHRVEQANKTLLARLLRELALDIEPPKESRPPRQYGA